MVTNINRCCAFFDDRFIQMAFNTLMENDDRGSYHQNLG